MKKILLIAALSILSISGLFASNHDGEKINTAVKNSFNNLFKNVSNVKWNKVHEVYIAYFTQNNNDLIAYFNENGEFSGTGRIIDAKYLPLSVSMTLSEKYSGYAIIQSLEYASNTDGTSYIIYLGNQKKNKVVRIFIDGAIEKIK